MATVWALDLLALTGRRRNEILTLQWPMVDWQHSLLDLPDTKTGRLKVPLSARVLALLKHIHEQTGKPTTGYVLRTYKGTRLRSLNSTWNTIRIAAGIPDVRLHDLRHSFASDALMSGVSLAVVGELLGHKQTRTTQRYAHLANHVVRQGLEIATERIVEALARRGRHGALHHRPPPAPRVSETDALAVPYHQRSLAASDLRRAAGAPHRRRRGRLQRRLRRRPRPGLEVLRLVAEAFGARSLYRDLCKKNGPDPIVAAFDEAPTTVVNAACTQFNP